RQAATAASGSSHPPKKLKGDHKTFSGAATGGKSSFPIITSSVSATPEHESGVPADSITGLNIRTIGASERFVISSDSSYHSSTNASGAEADSIVRSDVVPSVMTEAVVTSHVVNVPSISETGTKVTASVHASMFHDSNSTETMKAETVGPSYSAKQDLSMGSRELNSETLHQISEMDYHHLFTEFNVGNARQACLNAEVRMRTEYCLSERKRLESECEKQAGLLKAEDDEVESFKAQLLLKETEAAEATSLRVQVAATEAMDKMHVDEIDALKRKNVVLENEKESPDRKVAELQSSVSTKDIELKDLNVVVSSLRSQKDNLVDQVHALETTCSGLRDQVSKYERLKEQIEDFQDS
ncbi:hypothetical protein Tco_1271256, partial [Tanacetum coccineum]